VYRDVYKNRYYNVVILWMLLNALPENMLYHDKYQNQKQIYFLKPWKWNIKVIKVKSEILNNSKHRNKYKNARQFKKYIQKIYKRYIEATYRYRDIEWPTVYQHRKLWPYPPALSGLQSSSPARKFHSLWWRDHRGEQNLHRGTPAVWINRRGHNASVTSGAVPGRTFRVALALSPMGREK